MVIDLVSVFFGLVVLVVFLAVIHKAAQRHRLERSQRDWAYRRPGEMSGADPA